jgi:hypothetical protein
MMPNAGICEMKLAALEKIRGCFDMPQRQALRENKKGNNSKGI